MNSFQKYSFLILTALLFSACANRATFEWIKINPDKIKEANTRIAYRNGIKNIDLTLDLKEKTIPIYFDSPEAFEEGNNTPLVITKPEMSAKPRVKSKTIIRPAIVNRKPSAPKTIYRKPVEIKKITPSKTIIAKAAAVKKLTISKPEKKADSVNREEEKIALEKLNGALKIPKKPIKQIIGEQKETTPIVKKEVKKDVSVNHPKKVKVLSNLKIEQKKLQTEVKSAIDRKDKLNDFLKARKGNNFILAGTALAVIGVILGLIFGKSAYLVSGVGVIFAAIGFILKA